MQRDGAQQLRKEARARGFGSLAEIPLLWDGRGIGLLALYAADSGHSDPAEMRLLQDLAGDVAFALEFLEMNEKAQRLAYYDPLTRLANRTLFQERLGQFVATAASDSFAVMLIDLERFKKLNDTFGRAAGDALLKSVAERVTALVPHIRVSRIGADQFAVIIPDVKSEDELVAGIERRMKDLFGMAYLLPDGEVRLSGRLGIAIYPQHGATPRCSFATPRRRSSRPSRPASVISSTTRR